MDVRMSHYDFTENNGIEGFIEHMAGLDDTIARPWWLHWHMYFLISLLGMTYAYRAHLSCKSGFQIIVYVKEVD
jgi:hypothetical protein